MEPEVVGLEGFAGGSEGWQHSTASVAAPGEGGQHARAVRLASWARNKSSEVQLTGAHVPLTPEQIAEIEGRRESHHVPTPLGKQEAQGPKLKVTSIERYSFLDDGKRLEGIGALADKVSCNFGPTGFNLVIRDDEFSERRLVVDDLAHPINPEASKIMVKPAKIVVSLRKEVESKWHNLRK